MQVDKFTYQPCSQAIIDLDFFIATIQIGVVCYTPLARCVTYTYYQLLLECMVFCMVVQHFILFCSPFSLGTCFQQCPETCQTDVYVSLE